MIHIIEEILQDTYGFYNKSAKRQRRLTELAQITTQKTMEDAAIEGLEKAVEETLKKGMYTKFPSHSHNLTYVL